MEEETVLYKAAEPIFYVQDAPVLRRNAELKERYQ